MVKAILKHAKKTKKDIPTFINKQNGMGTTSLMAGLHNIDTLQMLLEHGADTTLQETNGDTVFDNADMIENEFHHKRVLALLEGRRPAPAVQPIPASASLDTD